MIHINYTLLFIIHRWSGMPKHIKIMRNSQTERFYVSDACDFDSIEELVDYYQKNTLGVSFPGVDTTLRIPYSEAARHHSVSGSSSSSSMLIMSPPPFGRDSGSIWVEAVYDYEAEGPQFLSFHVKRIIMNFSIIIMIWFLVVIIIILIFLLFLETRSH